MGQKGFPAVGSLLSDRLLGGNEKEFQIPCCCSISNISACFQENRRIGSNFDVFDDSSVVSYQQLSIGRDREGGTRTSLHLLSGSRP